MMNPKLPRIIQGGMGVGISGWQLAQEVSRLGQQGTVSGVALERIVARLLQKGDPGGHIRRALAHFPFQDIADRVLREYFVEGGVKDEASYKGVSVLKINPSRLLIELIVCANYAFVWLSKEGHDNEVSINYLEKIALPHIYAISGALLAGVDCITMGAGIPLQIPGVINSLVEQKPVEYRVPVVGTRITSHVMHFDPAHFFGRKLPQMKKPRFIPIVASNLLAAIFTKKLPAGSVSGFVVEEPVAGGHNAPPRRLVRNDQGETLPLYGEKDVVDYGEIAKLGLPFWIGGAYASPERLALALSIGAAGIQAGSIFALSEESAMDPEIRRQLRRLGYEGTLTIRTDMRISPTGFPFKMASLPGTISEPAVYESRPRTCSQGSLVELYERPDGKIGCRCAGEPAERFIAKGGKVEDTIGRGCLCNGLLATVSLADRGEAPIVTLGDDTGFLRKLMKSPDEAYSAKDAVKWLLS